MQLYHYSICSGNSRPQNQAIAGAIQKDVRDAFSDTYKVRGNGAPEGNPDSGWIILDYGDIMVHIMTPKSRLYFDIEGKWKGKGAQLVDVSHCLTTIKPSSLPFNLQNEATRATGQVVNTANRPRDEDDPFWA